MESTKECCEDVVDPEQFDQCQVIMRLLWVNMSWLGDILSKTNRLQDIKEVERVRVINSINKPVQAFNTGFQHWKETWMIFIFNKPKFVVGSLTLTEKSWHYMSPIFIMLWMFQKYSAFRQRHLIETFITRIFILEENLYQFSFENMK